MRAPAIIALTEQGARTARTIQAALNGAVVHGRRDRVADCDAPFDHAARAIAELFEAGHPVIGVCASAILIRAVAPLLGDKRAEPPLLAVAEDASAVVPLLGGHRGANRLARRIGEALSVAPAITTAGDLRLGVALDDPPEGWRVGTPETVKSLAGALLAGEPVSLTVEAGEAQWLTDRLNFTEDAAWRVRVTDRTVSNDPNELVLCPPVLALGVGCERDAAPEELSRLVGDCLAEASLSPLSVAGVFSIDLKVDEPAVHELAAALDVPARFYSADELAEQAPRLATPSDVVLRETGTPGVAEAAALAAAGPEAELVVPKRKSRRCTCAVARAPQTIAAMSTGRARGSLSIVGIGPGRADWRTPAATLAIAEAEHVVGYGPYLDLLGGLIAGKQRHQSQLGEEHDRVRKALELAASGARVALISSGDAGVYGLATLVFEMLEREDDASWNRVAVSVEPGVSAVQAAAARIGAPINHDFCAISLSDLLTPSDAIERRVKAAAEADFVIALYNPRSATRSEPFARALDVLRAHRDPDTPVVLARQLGRHGESVKVTSLALLNADTVDMLTLVLIGSSETRRASIGRREAVYTPRGYHGKVKT